jgi:NAD(P)H-quinone oxidoreductase subunit 6
VTLGEGVQFVSVIILSVMTLGTALGVVLLSNIVYSAFLLGGVFMSISGIYILLNADFVAAAQLLIYVGAVNVLILFAIMLVNKREDFAKIRGGWVRKVSTGAVCFGLFLLLGTSIFITPWSLEPVSSESVNNTVVEIGKHFFSDFLLPFELASILLLMAMVGAIIIARRDLIPEIIPNRDTISTALTLPERPRELTSASKVVDK